MSTAYDAIVVGVGAMGSAACYHLAQSGAKVLGLEQFDIGHGLGSSGGGTRLIRMAYYEHPDYVPLLRRAYALWDELERESGERIFYRTGGLYMGEPGRQFIAGSLRSAREHGLPHELIEPRELRRRYPHFRLPDTCVTLYEADAGLLLSQAAIAIHARLAQGAGATIHTHETVREWSSDDHSVTVRTDRGEYHARQIIFTAGAWTAGLVRDLGVPLRVTRQILGWVAPCEPEPFRPGSPCWAIEHHDAATGGHGLFYGFPMLEGQDAMKVGYHHAGPPADPNTLDRSPAPVDEDDFRPLLRRYLPAADGPLHKMHVCMYTYSPDGHFIVDRHPHHPNVTLACGFSGHGYKFAPVIGHALADMVTRGTTDLPIGFLSRNRFANSELTLRGCTRRSSSDSPS